MYKKLAGKNLVAEPLFFDDLHRQYRDAITDLESSKQSLHGKEEPMIRNASLLQQSVPGSAVKQSESVTVVTGSFPLNISGGLLVLARNIGAYVHVLEAGSDNFLLAIHTQPEGATVVLKGHQC